MSVTNYVSAAAVIVDGEELVDVKRVREGRRTLRRQFKVMRRRGQTNLTPDFIVELDTTIPEDGPGYDYDAIENKTLTIEYENGVKVIYLNASVLEIGDEEFDAENETIRKVTIGAGARQVQS